MYEGNGFKRTPQMKHRQRRPRYARMNDGYGYLCPKCRDIIMYDRQDEHYFCRRKECQFRESKADYAHTLKEIRLTLARQRAVQTADLDRGIVYYLRFRDAIKIGTTSGALVGRIVAHPWEEVLGVEPGGIDVETLRHAQFARALLPGHAEWFEDCQMIRDHIEAMLDENREWFSFRYPAMPQLPWKRGLQIREFSPTPMVG